MQFLKRFWPKRLYGQIMLAAAAALLLAQIINAIFLINGMNERHINDAASVLINSGAVQSEWANRDNRQILRQRFNQRSERRNNAQGNIGAQNNGRRNFNNPRFGRRNVDIMRSDEPLALPTFAVDRGLTERAAMILGDIGDDGPYISIGDINALPNALRGRAFQRQNRRQLERDNENFASRVMLLSFKNSDNQWVIASRLIRPVSNRAIWGLIFQTLLIFSILLGVLAIITRRISKPLDQLNQGMVNFARGDSHSGENNPITSAGPHDVRQLIDNYNEMSARISSLLSEKDVMLGAIGHDLKTPLASLRVRVESIDDDIERLQMIRSIDDMNIMLSDILTLARLGKSHEKMIKTDIAALIETVVDDFPDSADKIIFKPSNIAIYANIRPALLRRALRNIIGNALRYGGNAVIETNRQGEHFSIIISDNGPGISLDKLETVFEPFERIETSRNKALGGSGLGLTISRAIVTAHGGDIGLKNINDNGASGLQVTINLPL